MAFFTLEKFGHEHSGEYSPLERCFSRKIDAIDYQASLYGYGTGKEVSLSIAEYYNGFIILIGTCEHLGVEAAFLKKYFTGTLI